MIVSNEGLTLPSFNGLYFQSTRYDCFFRNPSRIDLVLALKIDWANHYSHFDFLILLVMRKPFYLFFCR